MTTQKRSYMQDTDAWLTEQLNTLEPNLDLEAVKKALKDRILGYIRVSQLMKCPDEACFIAVSAYLTGYATGSESVQEPTVR